MNIERRLTVPTGDILIVAGEWGQLECLSLGDYGQHVNLKCDAIGLNRNIKQVTHTDLLPLTEKWVVTISTQYGCSMNCEFCDVPNVGHGRNATLNDLLGQVDMALSLHPEITSTKRLNIHYARMGEPTFNTNVLESARTLYWEYNTKLNIHPVVSTMMPCKNNNLAAFIKEWMSIKNLLYEGNAGLQLSINSTDETERHRMFAGNACTLEEIATIMNGIVPVGRKITLNFAVAEYTIDSTILLRYFDPAHYIIKLTSMHKTLAAINNGVFTQGDYTTIYPYQDIETKLKEAGYDVLVFIASEYEDQGRITCGNAILSGTIPQVPYTEELERSEQ